MRRFPNESFPNEIFQMRNFRNEIFQMRHCRNEIFPNAIPKKIIDNCEKNYRKRLEKVLDLDGERLEPFHLQEIKKNQIKKKKILKKILKKKKKKKKIN